MDVEGSTPSIDPIINTEDNHVEKEFESSHKTEDNTIKEEKVVEEKINDGMDTTDTNKGSEEYVERPKECGQVEILDKSSSRVIEEEDILRLWDHPKGNEPVSSSPTRNGRIIIEGLPLDKYNYELRGLHQLVLQLLNELSKFIKINNIPMVRRPRPGETELHLQFSKGDKKNVMNYIKKKQDMTIAFNGMKLKFLGLQNLHQKSKEELESVNVSDLVKIAVPYQEFPYEVQLEKKMERFKNELKWIMDEKFQDLPWPEIHKFEEAPIKENYLNTLSVFTVRDDKTGKIEAGFKIHIKTVPKIIPLDKLIFAPKKFAKLVENFVEWCSSPNGFVVSNAIISKTGEILGLNLQMNANEQIVMTVLVKVPFSKIAKHGNWATTLDELPESTFKEIKKKATMLLDEIGSEYDVKAIYLRGWTYKGSMLSKDSETILLKGSSVEEPFDSGMGLYVEPKCQWSASSSSEARMIDLIVKLGNIDKDTTVFVSASTSKFVPYIIAQKAKEVTALVQLHSSDYVDSMTVEVKGEARARKLNDKIEFIPKYEPGFHAKKLKGCVFILWGTLQNWATLKLMLGEGVKEILFANVREVGVMKVLKQMSICGFMPKEIIPLDSMPHTFQYGIVMSFKKAPGRGEAPEKPLNNMEAKLKKPQEKSSSGTNLNQVMSQSTKRTRIVSKSSDAETCTKRSRRERKQLSTNRNQKFTQQNRRRRRDHSNNRGHVGAMWSRDWNFQLPSQNQNNFLGAQANIDVSGVQQVLALLNVARQLQFQNQQQQQLQSQFQEVPYQQDFHETHDSNLQSLPGENVPSCTQHYTSSRNPKHYWQQKTSVSSGNNRGGIIGMSNVKTVMDNEKEEPEAGSSHFLGLPTYGSFQQLGFHYHSFNEQMDNSLKRREKRRANHNRSEITGRPSHDSHISKPSTRSSSCTSSPNDWDIEDFQRDFFEDNLPKNKELEKRQDRLSFPQEGTDDRNERHVGYSRDYNRFFKGTSNLYQRRMEPNNHYGRIKSETGSRYYGGIETRGNWYDRKDARKGSLFNERMNHYGGRSSRYDERIEPRTSAQYNERKFETSGRFDERLDLGFTRRFSKGRGEQ